MNMLILNNTQQAELTALNASGDPARQLEAVPLTSGDTALGADLLNDCNEGQTWQHYAPFLQSLPTSEVPPSALVELQTT